MYSKADAEYRLRLAKGFYQEAEQDCQLKRWRSCVDNSQLAVENTAKMVIAIFEPVEKTHDPSRQLQRLFNSKSIGVKIAKSVNTVISKARELGFEEHIMSDYGDESSYKDPWQLFDQREAKRALSTARQCLRAGEKVYAFYF